MGDPKKAKEDEKMVQGLVKKEEELKAREADVKVAEKHLGELGKFLERKERTLAEREKALPSVIDTGPAEAKPMSKAGQKLIDEACGAYGIDQEYVLSSNYYPETGEAVIVTHGGAKVRYKKGDEVEELAPERVDGISRKKPRHVAGKKKK